MKQFNIDDVPEIDGANIGRAIKLKFHVASHTRTQLYLYSFVLFSRNCFLLEVINGTHHRRRAH